MAYRLSPPSQHIILANPLEAKERQRERTEKDHVETEGDTEGRIQRVR